MLIVLLPSFVFVKSFLHSALITFWVCLFLHSVSSSATNVTSLLIGGLLSN